MTKLLVSVKSCDEAKLALQADVDFIDLKDPMVGALGELSDALSVEIVKLVNKAAVISATVGEHHQNQAVLLKKIDRKIDIGIDIIKLPLSYFFNDEGFLQQLSERVVNGAKFVAVMFADEDANFDWIHRLARLGFYGVMLDTYNKNKSLVSTMSAEKLRIFVNNCEINRLQSGLAGSLRVEYISELAEYSPCYLGFRSGVCVNYQRDSVLASELVQSAKNQLYKHNKNSVKAYA